MLIWGDAQLLKLQWRERDSNLVQDTKRLMSSGILRNSLLKKYDQSDMDPLVLERLRSLNLIIIINIKSFNFSNLYATIPHQNLRAG